jgi:hypothetical protein
MLKPLFLTGGANADSLCAFTSVRKFSLTPEKKDLNQLKTIPNK